MTSPFDELPVDDDATEAEVDAAYRRRVKEAHPDQGGSAAEFLAVRDAYETLKRRYNAGELEGAEDGQTDDGAAHGTAVVEYLDFEVLADHGWDLDDADLFEKAGDAGLDGADFGRFEMEMDDPVLGAAEACGFSWPFACRGGACANCAVKVVSGEMSTPVDHILPPEMTERGIRLSCVGRPESDELQLVYNVKHVPALDDLRLPPRPFEQANVES